MKTYEITFITKEDLKGQPVIDLVKSLGGQVLEQKTLGQRQLSFAIKKETSGFYTTVSFELDPAKNQELDRKLSLHDEVLRHLITIAQPVRPDEAKAEVAAEPIEKVEEAPAQEAEEPAEEPVSEAEPVVEEPAKDEPIKEKEEEKEEAKAEPVKKSKTVETPAKPKRVAKPKAQESIEEVTQEDRLKALDKKLDELLKD